jgi:hypothetical protein
MNSRQKSARAILSAVGVVITFAAQEAAAFQEQDLQTIEPQSNACFSSHNFGSGAKTMNICISEHGNVVKFEAPAGVHQIGQANLFRDGYALCTGSPPAKTYYDTGAIEAGFGPSTIIQPNGPNTFPLTIMRDTTDGVWRLSQKYTRDTKERDLTIDIILTNLSASTQPVVRLQRAFEGDVDNNTNTNAFFGRTHDSVWEWVETLDTDGRPQGHGLMLSNLSLGTDHATIVNTVANYDPNGTGLKTGNGCVVFSGQTATPAAGGANLVGRLIYGGSVPAGGKLKRKVVYRVF